ncbi:MAG: hypothetical protein MMC23_005953 [Stictis urceolatum]|nr:hypothetical protein [Stictis urceolata]
MEQNYNLLPTTVDDVPRLAAIETEAIQPSPLNSVFFHNWANLDAQSCFFGSQIREHIDNPCVQVMKAVQSRDGGCVAVHGFLVWSIEGAIEQEDSVAPPIPAPDAVAYDQNVAGSKYTYAEIAERLEKPASALNLDFCNVAFAKTGQLKAHMAAGRRRYACMSSA